MAKSKLEHESEMRQSVFWRKGFIPIYFIAALLLFLLFHFYIGASPSIYLIMLFLIGLGIASIIYNNNKKSVHIKNNRDENKL